MILRNVDEGKGPTNVLNEVSRFINGVSFQCIMF